MTSAPKSSTRISIVARSVVAYRAAPSDLRRRRGGRGASSWGSPTSTTVAPSLSATRPLPSIRRIIFSTLSATVLSPYQRSNSTPSRAKSARWLSMETRTICSHRARYPGLPSCNSKVARRAACARSGSEAQPAATCGYISDNSCRLTGDSGGKPPWRPSSKYANPGYSSRTPMISIPICVPQSPKWGSRVTVCPRRAKIRARESPMMVDRRCPTCIGLATLGPP